MYSSIHPANVHAIKVAFGVSFGSIHCEQKPLKLNIFFEIIFLVPINGFKDIPYFLRFSLLPLLIFLHADLCNWRWKHLYLFTQSPTILHILNITIYITKVLLPLCVIHYPLTHRWFSSFSHYTNQNRERRIK